MKILVIGDVHGRNEWEKHVNENQSDLVVFMGDYVDSFNKTNIEIFDNLKNIIKFKKLNKESVILLSGNHDNQYMLAHPNDKNNTYRCSGFKPEQHFDLYDLFNKNKDLFQACYQHHNHIFTHAGITNDWFFNRLHGKTFESIEKQINEAFQYKYEPLFDVGFRRGGSFNCGGIFWADKHDLIIDPLKGFKQVVGHTVQENITTIGDVTFCDTGDKMIPLTLDL
ncbi:MAG: metallophosphoesterase [bacterium]